jgi:translation initiation factor IF-2
MPPSLGLDGPTVVSTPLGRRAQGWSEKRGQSSIAPVRRRLVWLIAGIAIIAVAVSRLFLRRPSAIEPLAPPPPPPAPPPEPAEDRAAELRRRIDESREVLDERDEFEAAETPLDEADPQARRREVHERARQMVERMRRDEPEA